MERLTLYEREQIALHTKQGFKIRAIARIIKRDHSVVSRELKRNKSQLQPYQASSAQYYAERRAKKTNVRKLEKYPELRDWVRVKLKEKWSPEQISGRLKEHPPPKLKGLLISYEAIYQWIYAQSPKGEPWLYHQLRRRHPERRLRGGRKKRSKVLIKDLVPISHRGEAISSGNFEADSIVGRHHKGGLSVHYDRGTQLVRIYHLDNLKAEETLECLEATVEDLPHGYVKSFTFDRGSETTLHYKLRETYNLDTFHCDPYCPYQKGGVEQVNGLIRQFFPKSTDFRYISTDQVAQVEELLNERPRKKLNYKTPNEMLGGALNS